MADRRPDVLKTPLIDRRRVDECLRMVEMALCRGNRDECLAAIALCFSGNEPPAPIGRESSLAEIGLDNRLVNTLEGHRIMYVWQLCQRRKSYLLTIPNLGSKQLKQIVDALSKHGFRLREEA